MILSSYLLLTDRMEPILDAFTSTYGRSIVDEALDDLCVLQDYVAHEKELIKYDLNVDEISDIAYSYYKYKQTGVCERHVYASPEEDVDRFGNSSENKSDGYKYTKFEPFNMQSVWQCLMSGDTDFPVEAEFNTFAKEWVRTSMTLRRTRSIKVLGYDSNQNFGYVKTVSPNDVNPKTLELFLKLLNYAKEQDPFEGTGTRVDYTLKRVQEFLATPNETKIIFDTTYNRLNNLRASDDDCNTGYQNMLYDKESQVIDDLGHSQANYKQQLEHVLHDCKVIFDARFKNTALNKELYRTAEDFIANIPEDVSLRYGAITNEAIEFIHKLYKLKGNAPTSMPQSTLAILELYLTLQEFTLDMINLKLGLNFDVEDYVDASKELYQIFGIPFYFGDAGADLSLTISNGYGIAEEEDKFDKPQPQLIEFAYICARSVQSKSARLFVGGAK